MNKISAIGKGKNRGRDRDSQRGNGILDILNKVAKSTKLGSTLAKQIPGLSGKVAGDVLANLGYGKKATSQRRKRERTMRPDGEMPARSPMTSSPATFSKAYDDLYNKSTEPTKATLDTLVSMDQSDFNDYIDSNIDSESLQAADIKRTPANRKFDIIAFMKARRKATSKVGEGKKKRRGQKGKGFLADIAGVLGGMIPGVGRFASPLIQSGIEHLGLGRQSGSGRGVPVGSFRAATTRIPKRAAGPHIDMIGGSGVSRGGLHRQTGYGVGATSLSQSLPSMGVQGFKKPSTGPRF